jgi:hypothetical protein
MARHKLTAAQILRGLKKALANRKTPKQFRASLRARIKRLS